MRVHLGSDHAGLELKDHLMTWLVDHGYEPVDHGPFVYDALDDYPVFCLRAAEAVAAEQAEGLDSLGVVIGGSGNGEQMAANKVIGVRAALVWNDATAQLALLRNLPESSRVSVGLESGTAPEGGPGNLSWLVDVGYDLAYRRERA